MKALSSWKSVYFLCTVSSFHKQLKLMLQLRNRLVFPLTQLRDHTVSSYCHKQVWPWGGLDQFWVKVKPGGWRKVYFWLGAFACFAGWALGSAQGRGSDCLTTNRLLLCNCKARWSTVAAKPLPNLPSSREQASTHDHRNGSAHSGSGLIQLCQSNLTCASGGQQDSRASRDMSRKQQDCCTRHLAVIPDAQKMWPALLGALHYGA